MEKRFVAVTFCGMEGIARPSEGSLMTVTCRGCQKQKSGLVPDRFGIVDVPVQLGSRSTVIHAGRLRSEDEYLGLMNRVARTTETAVLGATRIKQILGILQAEIDELFPAPEDPE